MEAVAAKGWFGERADDGRGKESEGCIIVVVGVVRCVEGKGKSYVGFRAFVCGVLVLGVDGGCVCFTASGGKFEGIESDAFQ